MPKRQKSRGREEEEISGSKLSRRGRKIKYRKWSMPSMRGETMMTTPTKNTNKMNDKETTGGTYENRSTKKAKSKYPPKHNYMPWR
ncbi:hypothetical protein J1N35_013935 [Gossypium stocksii]|uniref:Uncharacterized protein n=1 Tax=Gossypium stocksii TaxID=47602 RepID=A0A9D3VUY1_9ROSI|nr:hypothetical protein J1N35_013935 [Gossypium stocksii]